MEYYLSIDIGTSEIKVVLFDKKFNLKIKQNCRNNVVYTSDGRSEVDMQDLWKRCKNLIFNIFKRHKSFSSKIICVGITANMVGLWPIDNNGKPVRKAILWNDNRTKNLIDKLRQKESKLFHKIFLESGSVMQFGCTIPLIKWFEKNENNKFKKTKWFLTCKDWIRFKLTNEIANDYTETVVAPGSAIKINRSEKIFKLFKLSKASIYKLPVIKKSDSIGGFVTKKASKETNIKLGTPVSIGAGDVPTSVIGLGAIENKNAATIFGTTIHNCYVSTKPLFKPKDIGLLFYAPNNTWLKTMINVAGTMNLEWVIKNFFDIKLYKKNKTKYINLLENIISQKPIGSNGLIYLPYINYGGVIAPFFNEEAKGVFFGLNHNHDKYDILRSVYEGVSLSIVDCYKSLNMKIDKLLLAGGGSKSKIWSQMISDSLGIRVLVPKGEEFGAKGAAIIASVAKYKKNSNYKLQNKLKIYKHYLPNKTNTKQYNELYKKYRLLSRKLFFDVQ